MRLEWLTWTPCGTMKCEVSLTFLVVDPGGQGGRDSVSLAQSDRCIVHVRQYSERAVGEDFKPGDLGRVWRGGR